MEDMELGAWGAVLLDADVSPVDFDDELLEATVDHLMDNDIAVPVDLMIEAGCRGMIVNFDDEGEQE